MGCRLHGAHTALNAAAKQQLHLILVCIACSFCLDRWQQYSQRKAAIEAAEGSLENFALVGACKPGARLQRCMPHSTSVPAQGSCCRPSGSSCSSRVCMYASCHVKHCLRSCMHAAGLREAGHHPCGRSHGLQGVGPRSSGKDQSTVPDDSGKVRSGLGLQRVFGLET